MLFRSWPVQTLVERVQALTEGVAMSADLAGKHNNDPRCVLELDGVMNSAETTAAPSSVTTPSATPKVATVEVSESSDVSPATTPATTNTPAAAATTKSAATEGDGSGANKHAVVEQTVRVEVARLESLLNLVGQLVLNKNRVLGLARQLREAELPHELKEDINSMAGDLDRLTSELQVGVKIGRAHV